MEDVLRILNEMIVPFIHADGGKIYFVSSDEMQLSLHLAGSCSGCPGFSMTVRSVIEPILHANFPKVRLVVTNGSIIPPHAKLLE